MKTPFTSEQFFSVFEKYNTSIFPSQIILFLLVVVALLAIGSTIKQKDKFVSGILGLLWIWIGIVYQISFFSEINKVAFGFGVLFILQGLFFLWEGVLLYNLKFVFKMSIKAYLGYFFILYGLIVYPVVDYLIGQNITRIISIGLPCPTTILTFGFLLLCDKKFSKYLLIIPSVWAVIGLSAVINLGVYQDSMMIIAAIIANVWLLKRKESGNPEELG
jgi:hypothetical protein